MPCLAISAALVARYVAFGWDEDDGEGSMQVLRLFWKDVSNSKPFRQKNDVHDVEQAEPSRYS